MPADERPPANIMLHCAFDTMVGIGTVLIGLARGSAFAWWRRETSRRRVVPARVALSGVASVVALEGGWITTEVGRQPWIVYEIMRTDDGDAGRGGLGRFGLIAASTRSLGVALVVTLRAMARRWRAAGEPDSAARTSRPRGLSGRPREQRRRCRRRAVGRGDVLRRLRRG